MTVYINRRYQKNKKSNEIRRMIFFGISYFLINGFIVTQKSGSGNKVNGVSRLNVGNFSLDKFIFRQKLG